MPWGVRAARAKPSTGRSEWARAVFVCVRSWLPPGVEGRMSRAHVTGGRSMAEQWRDGASQRARRQDAKEVARYLRPTTSHMPELPLLELQCFGVPGARLSGSPAPPELLRRKHLALLVYLALSPQHRRTRAHLVGVLWPETGEAQARHSLNEAVRRLRAHVGEARLASDGDAIVLREEGLEVDALRF